MLTIVVSRMVKEGICTELLTFWDIFENFHNKKLKDNFSISFYLLRIALIK